jgi:hypothetical protein
MCPPQTLRLRECGLASPRIRFRAVLNVRCIVYNRELKDKTLKFDERIAPRKTAYEAWIKADRAYCARAPEHIVAALDDTYFDALQTLNLVSDRREKRIKTLKTNIALMRAALNSR